MTSITLQRSKSACGIAYHEAGSGAPILLIHGVGLCAEAWFQQLPALTAEHRVLAIDMPGHGQSELIDSREASLDDYVGKIGQWLESEIDQPALVIGHSMGAMIALALAARFPQLCAGVCALNAVYRRTEEAKLAVRQRARQLLEQPDGDRVSAPLSRWFDTNKGEFEREMASLCGQWLEAAPAAGYAAAYGVFSREDGPSDQALEGLAMPAWFITGDGDANSNGPMSEAMAARCAKGVAHVVEDARHMVQLTHPDIINQQLLRFAAACQTQPQRGACHG